MNRFLYLALAILSVFIWRSPSYGSDPFPKCFDKLQVRIDSLSEADKQFYNLTETYKIISDFDWGKLPTTLADPNKIKAFNRLYESTAELLTVVGNQFSAKGMRGYTHFAGGIIRSDGTDFIAELKHVFGGNNFDSLGFNAVMEKLDSGTWLAQGRWKSAGGLIYDTMPTEQGHRLSHVFDHTVPNPAKNKHAIFSVNRSEILDLVDEGFGRAVQHPTDKFRFEVDMSPRTVGTAGEKKMRIVVDPKTNRIITAHPLADSDVTVPGI